MKHWKKTYQAVYMSLDIKPFGKWKKAVGKITRSKLKQELQKEVKTYEPSSACPDER